MKPKLRVQTEGKRHYLSVACAHGNDLLHYLRAHHIRSLPPEPYMAGYDNIELGQGIDVAEVQRLLDAWV